MGATEDFTSGLPQDFAQLSRLAAESNYYCLEDLTNLVKKLLVKKTSFEQRLDQKLQVLFETVIVSAKQTRNICVTRIFVERLFAQKFSNHELENQQAAFRQSEYFNQMANDLNDFVELYSKIK